MKKSVKYTIIKRSIATVMSAVIAFTLIPVASLADTEEPQSALSTQTVNLQEAATASASTVEKFKKITSPGKPENYTENPGKNNPYGKAVGESVVLNPQLELLTYNVSGSNQEYTIYENLQMTLSNRNQDSSIGGAKTYFNESPIYNEDAVNETWEDQKPYTVGNTETETYKASYVQSVAWDPEGSGFKDYAAFCGVYWDKENGSRLQIWTLDTRDPDNTISNTVICSQKMSWLEKNTLSAYMSNNFFSITAGDYNADGVDELVVYVCGDGDEYGLTSLYYDVANKKLLVYSSAKKTLLHETYKTSACKNSQDKTCRLCCALETGDFNSDGIDDLAAVSYINRPNDKAFRNDAVELYMPYLAVSLGKEGSNSIVDNISGHVSVVSSEYKSEGEIIRKSMLAPGIAVGNVYGDGQDRIVLAGYQNKIVSSESDSKKAKSPYSDLPTTFDNTQYAVYSVTENGSICSDKVDVVDTTKWFRSGSYPRSDDVWAQNAVECVKINGSDLAEAVFINGALYQIDKDGTELLSCPSYFNQNDNGAKGSTVTNVYISSVTAGNFDRNTAGREQLVFIIGLKCRSASSYYYKYGAIGGTNYQESYKTDADATAYNSATGNITYECKASAYWCTDIDDVKGNDIGEQYVIEGESCNLDNYQSCTVVAVNRDHHATQLRFSEGGTGWAYTNPEVPAILQAAPYFRELGSSAGSTSYTVTTTYGVSREDGTTNTYGTGIAVSAKIGLSEKIGIYIDAKAGWEYSFGTTFTKSYTRKYTETFKVTDQDCVVIMRVPYINHNYFIF